jgi:hypothetical protein
MMSLVMLNVEFYFIMLIIILLNVVLLGVAAPKNPLLFLFNHFVEIELKAT